MGTTPQPPSQQKPHTTDSPSAEGSQAQSAHHPAGVWLQPPVLASADEMQDQQRLRQERSEIYTQLMMDSIYEAQPALAPGQELINKAVSKAAEFMSQYDRLEEARPSILQFAGKCLKSHAKYYTDRASMGYDDDDAEMVDAILIADEMMTELLPAAFNVCVEQQERCALAQSIDQELQRVEREKELQREAEAQQPAAPQSAKCNAEDVTRLIVGRMAELFYNSSGQRAPLAHALTDSLRGSLQLFFADTLGTDAPYLTKAAIDHVDRMRQIESKRIQDTGLTRLAAMQMIRHVGKIMNSLPDAITEILKEAEFDPEAPPMRHHHDDEAEYELNEKEPDEPMTQGRPSSGTPPGTPPPLNPGKMPIPTFRRTQPGTPPVRGPEPPNLPPNKWQGWKTQTGSTLADLDQSRHSSSMEQESEMADPELREAMARSLHEMRRDPYEAPNTGGASGSGRVAEATQHQGVTSTQSATSNTQSDGEGSVLPKRPPTIFAGGTIP